MLLVLYLKSLPKYLPKVKNIQSFMFLALTFRLILHFALIFMCCEAGPQPHSFACGYPFVPMSFVEKSNLSPHCWESVGHKCEGIFLNSYFYFTDLCLSLCQSHCFEIGKCVENTTSVLTQEYADYTVLYVRRSEKKNSDYDLLNEGT